MTDTVLTRLTRQSDGYTSHTGHLKVSFKMPNGQMASVTLPDDWVTLVARVTALEARTLEDMKYGH